MEMFKERDMTYPVWVQGKLEVWTWKKENRALYATIELKFEHHESNV
jgi:hypothetical protein